MYNSFETLFSNIWESLDDVFICIASALVLRLISKWLYWCMHSYFRLSEYVSDVVDFVFLAIFSVFILIHLFGSEIATSLFGGFSIGLGYAFQPYIISLYTGVYNQVREIIKPGEKIFFNNKIVTVESVSLFHICIKDGTMITYIDHAFFKSNPLTKVCPSYKS